MCSTSCLKNFSVILGGVLVLISATGIGLTLFLIFDDPFYYRGNDTYSPSWEDVGPALIASIVSLLMNICLIGGAKQYSKDIVLSWIVWKIILVILFWTWFSYNHLKHLGYIDWTDTGMRSCYFCGYEDAEFYVTSVGAFLSLFIIIGLIPVIFFHSKLRKRYLQLTQPGYVYEMAEPIPQQHMISMNPPHNPIFHPYNHNHRHTLAEYKY